MLEKYKKDLKVVVKNFPLPNHPFARKAAAAALAAHRQGKFWEFHHKLFESVSSINDEKIQQIARGLKLDMDAFNRDVNDPAVQNLISRDLNEGKRAEVPGTPTLFVNGKRVQRDIEQEIDAVLKKESR